MMGSTIDPEEQRQDMMAVLTSPKAAATESATNANKKASKK